MLTAILFAGDLGAQVTPWTDDSPHQVRSVAVASDVRLEVLDWGGTGDVLVFVAGLAQNAHTWDDFAPRFTDRYHVLGITRRGHGSSTWPDAGYDLATLVGDLETALDSLGVRRAFLAGHSYGGVEITRFAAEDPGRVAGLIYIDAIQDLTQLPADVTVCPLGPQFEAAAEKAFRNLESFRHTQQRTSDDGTRQASG